MNALVNGEVNQLLVRHQRLGFKMPSSFDAKLAAKWIDRARHVRTFAGTVHDDVIGDE